MRQKSVKKQVRRSVSLRAEVDQRVQQIAKRRNWSANQVLENLIEAGLAAKEAEKRHFFHLAERLQESTDKNEISRIKTELARMTFGD